MDENEMMDPEIIKGLFEQGVSACDNSYRSQPAILTPF
jgi:hypothetical protein